MDLINATTSALAESTQVIRYILHDDISVVYRLDIIAKLMIIHRMSSNLFYAGFRLYLSIFSILLTFLLRAPCWPYEIKSQSYGLAIDSRSIVLKHS